MTTFYIARFLGEEIEGEALGKIEEQDGIPVLAVVALVKTEMAVFGTEEEARTWVENTARSGFNPDAYDCPISEIELYWDSGWAEEGESEGWGGEYFSISTDDRDGTLGYASITKVTI